MARIESGVRYDGMEPHARKLEIDLPVHPADDPAVRAGQQRHIAQFLKDYEAEHGPFDPKRLAAVDAQLDEIDAKLAEAERDA